MVDPQDRRAALAQAGRRVMSQEQRRAYQRELDEERAADEARHRRAIAWGIVGAVAVIVAVVVLLVALAAAPASA